MKTILDIFIKDIRGIGRNLFALIIAGGLCIIPSLYAWFNIYSNQDPYASTSAVKIAVYSEDAGFTLTDGTNSNMGDSVIDNLRENDKLGWTFTDSADEAIEGVKKGDYYAAIIIGDNFSRSMMDFIENGMESPSVKYYENAKKNAIASKITQSGMSSLQETINETFINTVVTTILDNSDLNEHIGSQVLTDVIDKLTNLENNLAGYDASVSMFMESNASLTATLNETNNLVADIQSDFSIERFEESKAAADTTIDEYLTKFDSVLDNLLTVNNGILADMRQLQTDIAAFNASQAEAAKQKLIDEINTIIGKLDTSISAGQSLGKELEDILNSYIPSDGSNNSSDICSALLSSLELIGQMQNNTKAVLVFARDYISGTDIETAKILQLANDSLTQAINTLTRLNEIYTTSISQAVGYAKSVIKTNINTIYTSLVNAYNNLSDVSMIITGISSSLGGVNTTLSTMDGLIDNVTEKIANVRTELNDIAGSQDYEIMQKLLDKSSAEYGEFFSSPVTITTENVYEAVNYGTAVSPFYTTLALWVGGLLLTALIKTSPQDREELKDAPLHQMYFGRYLIFWLMGQIQAVITVAGDLFLLHIHCEHPWIFMLTASLTSFTFTLLIYTLTLSFGDVGKALAVVLVVLQIAGSSGTYPIELLPSFFRTVYLYFPFPYAINAMRECVSGFYQYDYFILTAQLLFFVIASLLVGLVIRKPFMKLNHFMHKRMHDTQIM